MIKRVTAILLCAVMVLSLMPAISLDDIALAASTNLVTMPDHDGLTNNTTYTLGAGTDAEVTVTCDFRDSATAPTESITPRY